MQFKLLSLTLMAVSAVWLSGCTTTAEECDPSKDPGFFNKIGCSVSGAYSERVENKQQQVADLRAENARINALARDIYEENAILEGSISERQRALDKARSELYAVERSLQDKRYKNDALQQKLNQTKEQLNQMKQSTSANQSLIEKQQQIEELQALLDELSAQLI